MKRVGIVSYNMYGNFTNYGSALQTYALHHAIDRLDPDNIQSIVIDYCPDILLDKDVLNPIANMWDTDDASRERCRLSMPAIRKNYEKFKSFYRNEYRLSRQKYTSVNFNNSLEQEMLNGYVCGSDTIFAVPEFGFDNGFYANYDSMRGRSVAYAASFGDYDIPSQDKQRLSKMLSNFNCIALRENDKLSLVKSLITKPVHKVIDPTLLLKPSDYENIVSKPDIARPYLLLYSRRHNEAMQDYSEQLAAENGWDVVEISLNATNAIKHTMRYDAGVEEFLGLVRNASMVVTNSFHGMIFAIQFSRPFHVFSRKLCDTKITELLNLLEIKGRMHTSEASIESEPIDYDSVHARIDKARIESLDILRNEIIQYL